MFLLAPCSGRVSSVCENSRVPGAVKNYLRGVSVWISGKIVAQRTKPVVRMQRSDPTANHYICARQAPGPLTIPSCRERFIRNMSACCSVSSSMIRDDPMEDKWA